MAITTGGHSPIIMDAAGDLLSTVFQGRDMNSPTGVPKVCCTGIEFVAGGSGKCILKSGNGAGDQVIFESPSLNAGQNYYLRMKAWVMDIYVLSLPANSKVLVHYA